MRMKSFSTDIQLNRAKNGNAFITEEIAFYCFSLILKSFNYRSGENTNVTVIVIGYQKKEGIMAKTCNLIQTKNNQLC